MLGVGTFFVSIPNSFQFTEHLLLINDDYIKNDVIKDGKRIQLTFKLKNIGKGLLYDINFTVDMQATYNNRNVNEKLYHDDKRFVPSGNSIDVVLIIEKNLKKLREIYKMKDSYSIIISKLIIVISFRDYLDKRYIQEFEIKFSKNRLLEIIGEMPRPTII